MKKLSDEDVDRIADAVARKMVPQPYWSVLPAPVWVSPHIWTYDPYRVTCTTSASTNTWTSYNRGAL